MKDISPKKNSPTNQASPKVTSANWKMGQLIPLFVPSKDWPMHWGKYSKYHSLIKGSILDIGGGGEGIIE